MRNLDLPPLWLVLFLVIVWIATRLFPDWSVQSVELAAIGRGFVLVGIGLTAFALISFGRARTTPVPHRRARALITTGLYENSRNPIYLGLAVILLGSALSAGALSSFLPVVAFPLIITRRFIAWEEDELRRVFGVEAETYFAATGRWLTHLA